MPELARPDVRPTSGHDRRRDAASPTDSAGRSAPARAPAPRIDAPASLTTRRLRSTVPGMPETFVGCAGGDRVDDLLLGRRGPLEHADVPTEAQHGDPVGDLEDVVEVVRDDHDGEPLLAEPPHELEHLLGLRDAERRGRLVEDHDSRVPHHGPRDGDRLALAAGEGRDALPRST